MLTISGLTKFYGQQTLFSDVDLNIGPREKIGLVGRNGTGKSTFLKILLGEETAQEGDIEMPSGYRVKSLEQHLRFTEKTILEQVCKALPPNAIRSEGRREGEEWRSRG